MNSINWLVVALVLLLTCGITWAALGLIIHYCDRFPAPTESELDEEFP